MPLNDKPTFILTNRLIYQETQLLFWKRVMLVRRSLPAALAPTYETNMFFNTTQLALAEQMQVSSYDWQHSVHYGVPLLSNLKHMEIIIENCPLRWNIFPLSHPAILNIRQMMQRCSLSNFSQMMRQCFEAWLPFFGRSPESLFQARISSLYAKTKVTVIVKSWHLSIWKLLRPSETDEQGWTSLVSCPHVTICLNDGVVTVNYDDPEVTGTMYYHGGNVHRARVQDWVADLQMADPSGEWDRFDHSNGPSLLNVLLYKLLFERGIHKTFKKKVCQREIGTCRHCA